MKIHGGWGGWSAERRGSKQRGALAALGLAVALAVGAFVVPSEAAAGMFGGGWIPVPPSSGGGDKVGDEGEPPPKPPPSIQECFEDFISYQDRCVDVWCVPVSFLWFDWLDCQSIFLDTCVDAAELAYVCCMQGGPPCEDLQ